ncbi:MAG: endonuclease/exonuclease/phosphatase family protein [Flavobacteriaceae bacterium]|nr:endonuclease/exonuclease/phosphatase family protein [Flavobacteriaceae bacterium]
MSYNVRLFNVFNWINDKDIPTKITNFVKVENPDFLCLQEFHPLGENLFDYPYKYIETKGKTKNFGQAIFSKYRIVNKGSLDFKDTYNNAIFVDVVKGLDTIRVYNLHLESLGLNPKKENFGQKNSEKLIKRLTKEFIKQQEQVNLIIAHQKKCKYPMLVSGDFNNTAYSWTYKNIKGDMYDSFLEAGVGFGETFDIKSFPMRIDFIFATKILQINEHKNFKEKYSDHSPVMAIIGLE